MAVLKANLIYVEPNENNIEKKYFRYCSSFMQMQERWKREHVVTLPRGKCVCSDVALS